MLRCRQSRRLRRQPRPPKRLLVLYRLALLVRHCLPDEEIAFAGDRASILEDLATAAQLDKAAPILDKLETLARELIRQVNGLSIEALRHQQALAKLPATQASPDYQTVGWEHRAAELRVLRGYDILEELGAGGVSRRLRHAG